MKSLHHNIEFEIIKRICFLGFIELITAEGYGVTLLTKHASYVNVDASQLT